jgi:GMP synthase (glutamine-hydrolysing)
MLVFVDYEHADGHGERMLAARTRITYRLEDLAGCHCHLVRYDRIDQGLLDTLGATAIFISGNSRDPDAYGPEQVAPVLALVRDTDLPVFGFCGGFQLIAQALGADVVPLAADEVDAADPTMITLDDGRAFEYGYHPVDVTPGASRHPLLTTLDERPVFRHAHGLHVPEPPAGFDVLASTRVTPVQLAVHDERRIVGTQFHPEYWTDEHPDGRTLIANFLRWSGHGADA